MNMLLHQTARGLMIALALGAALATACSPGSARDERGEPLGTTSAAVKPGAKLVKVAIEPHDVHQLMVGDSLQLRALGTFTDGSVVDLTDQGIWSTTDASTASVTTAPAPAGKVTALATGTATVNFGPIAILAGNPHIPPGTS